MKEDIRGARSFTPVGAYQTTNKNNTGDNIKHKQTDEGLKNDPPTNTAPTPQASLLTFVALKTLFKEIGASGTPPPGVQPIPGSYAEDGRRILLPQAGVLVTLVNSLLDDAQAGPACRLVSQCAHLNRIKAIETLLQLANKEWERARLLGLEDAYPLLRQCLQETSAWLGAARKWEELEGLIKICTSSQEEVVFANLLLDQLVPFSDLAKRKPQLGIDSPMFKAVCLRAAKMLKASDDPYPHILCLASRCRVLGSPDTRRGLFVTQPFDLKELVVNTCLELEATGRLTDDKASEIYEALEFEPPHLEPTNWELLNFERINSESLNSESPRADCASSDPPNQTPK